MSRRQQFTRGLMAGAAVAILVSPVALPLATLAVASLTPSQVNR
jgi:hypothetical protein